MKIYYEENKEQENVSLSCLGHHIGTIWGRVYRDMKDEFEIKNNIINIKNNNGFVAVIWNALPLTAGGE